MDTEPTRVCRKCQQELPLSDFGNDKQNADGKRTMCKVCNRKAGAQWHRRHSGGIGGVRCNRGFNR